MALRVRKGWLAAGVAALAALFGWAWWDGGEVPQRLIAEPVSLPGLTR
ncbi:MAG: hypothetical protein O9296_14155 [Novosphingobium sp.]|nr:hypothetical protein [Novosphingobium sp.]